MIQLSERFRIHFDVKDNVTLEQLVEVTTKETKEVREEWRAEGYYNSIKNAVKKSFELEIRKSEDLDDLFRRLEDIERRVEQIFAFRFSQFFNTRVA